MHAVAVKDCVVLCWVMWVNRRYVTHHSMLVGHLVQDFCDWSTLSDWLSIGQGALLIESTFRPKGRRYLRIEILLLHVEAYCLEVEYNQGRIDHCCCCYLSSDTISVMEVLCLLEYQLIRKYAVPLIRIRASCWCQVITHLLFGCWRRGNPMAIGLFSQICLS